MKLWTLVILLISISVCAQTPKTAAPPERPAPPTPQLDDAEAHQRAWFAERRKAHPDLTQVAEGKYFMSDEESTPKETSAQDVWTLWKSPDGDFEAAGTLEFSDESVPYWIQLNPRMQPIAFRVFRWETTIGCRRTPSNLLCEETNDKGVVLRTVNDALNGPTEIFMPIIFFWAGLTRGSEIHGDEPARFTLLAQGSETQTFPVSFNPVEASLKVLHRGKYPVAHSEIDGAEFELAGRESSASHPNDPQGAAPPPGSKPPQPYVPMMKLWVSSNGILLTATPVDPEAGYVRLVEFKKFEDF